MATELREYTTLCDRGSQPLRACYFSTPSIVTRKVPVALNNVLNNDLMSVLMFDLNND